MKTLINSTKKTIAVITEKTTYLANSKGEIFKQFPTATFNAANYTQETEFPADFEVAKANFTVRQENAKLERERQYKIYRENQRETRKNQLTNLWNWRKGRIDAYLVATYVAIAEENSSYNPSGYNRELVFGEENAYARFDELKGSETPMWDMKSNNCYFVTELTGTYRAIPISERLNITTIEELEQLLVDTMDTISIDEYAPSIIDKDLVITFGTNSWGKISQDIIKYVDARRSWSGWVGNWYYAEQKTTADLGFEQTAVTIEEFCEQYPKEAKLHGYIK